MTSFQPKAEATPPDDEGPHDPPAPETTLEPAPSQTPAETDPMPGNSRRHRNAEIDFEGGKRSNTTRASTTDPDARRYKKSCGTGARLCFIGHVNRAVFPEGRFLWVLRRHGAGLQFSVGACLGPGGRDVADRLERAAVVEPVDP